MDGLFDGVTLGDIVGDILGLNEGYRIEGVIVAVGDTDGDWVG